MAWLLDPDRLRQQLHPPTPPLPADINARAAVLLLICHVEPEPFTFLTVRNTALPTHPGQISLPGGRIELADSSLEVTALREAEEEIGLDPACVRLLGRLPEVTVSSGIRITPVVGYTRETPQVSPEPREVAAILRCPLSHIADAGQFRRESVQRDTGRREFWVTYLEEHRVWGATGNILYALSACLR